MTQIQRTSTASPGLAVPQAEASAIGIDGALERLWHLLASMRFGLLLTLVLAVMTLLGTVIGQSSPEVLGNADAKAQFLVGARAAWYGPLVGILDPIGAFDVFHAPWFMGTAALLVASIVACSAHRAPGLWRTATKPNVSVGEGFFEHAPYRDALTIRQAPSVASERIGQVLRRHHFRTVVAEDGTLHLYGDRNRWAPLGSLAGHLSLVVILAGSLLGVLFGYHDKQFTIAEGSTAAVPTKAGATIQLLSFKDAYDPASGMPTDYASDVIVSRGGQQVARQTVRVNEPLRYEDVTFYQSSFGSAAVMKVTDAQGSAIFDDGVALAWSSGDGRAIGKLSLPSKGLTAWLVGTLGTDDTMVKPGQIRVELYDAQSGDPVTQQSIDLGTPTTIGGATFTFVKETKYSEFSVAKDPGTPLVWLGCFLLVAGFVLVFMFPHRRIWGRIEARPKGGSQISLASIGRNDTIQEREFTALVTDIRQAFQSPART